MNPRRSGSHGRIGCRHRAPQPRQASGAGKGSEEQPSGRSARPDQRESAREIVDAVQHADRKDQIERSVDEGQAILVALNTAGLVRKQPPGIAGKDLKASLP
jgi:hypothetical protein